MSGIVVLVVVDAVAAAAYAVSLGFATVAVVTGVSGIVVLGVVDALAAAAYSVVFGVESSVVPVPASDLLAQNVAVPVA